MTHRFPLYRVTFAIAITKLRILAHYLEQMRTWSLLRPASGVAGDRSPPVINLAIVIVVCITGLIALFAIIDSQGSSSSPAPLLVQHSTTGFQTRTQYQPNNLDMTFELTRRVNGLTTDTARLTISGPAPAVVQSLPLLSSAVTGRDVIGQQRLLPDHVLRALPRPGLGYIEPELPSLVRPSRQGLFDDPFRI